MCIFFFFIRGHVCKDEWGRVFQGYLLIFDYYCVHVIFISSLVDEKFELSTFSRTIDNCMSHSLLFDDLKLAGAVMGHKMYYL